MTPKARMILIGIIVPLVIAAAGVIALLVALPTLPNPVAVHWGPTGQADRFGSPVLALVLPAALVLAYSIFAAVLIRGQHGPSANLRTMLALSPSFALLLTLTVAGSTVAQAGLTDPREAGSILPLLAVAFAAALVVGIGAWIALPRAQALAIDTATPVTLPLGDSERASWMQRAEGSTVLLGSVTGILALAVLGGGAALWVADPSPLWIVVVVILVVVGALAIGSLSWRLTADRSGLRVRSAVGVPRFSIPLSEVESATVVDIQPVRDFGGWGIRFGGGRRLGLITRGGEALEVHRRNGRSLVVTVSDATTGAALLNTLSQRVQ